MIVIPGGVRKTLSVVRICVFLVAGEVQHFFFIYIYICCRTLIHFPGESHSSLHFRLLKTCSADPKPTARPSQRVISWILNLCVCVCFHVSTHVLLCMWEPEISLLSPSSGSITWFSEKRSPPGPGACQFSLAGLPASLSHPPFSVSPALKLQSHVITSGFLMRALKITVRSSFLHSKCLTVWTICPAPVWFIFVRTQGHGSNVSHCVQLTLVDRLQKTSPLGWICAFCFVLFPSQFSPQILGLTTWLWKQTLALSLTPHPASPTLLLWKPAF